MHTKMIAAAVLAAMAAPAFANDINAQAWVNGIPLAELQNLGSGDQIYTGSGEDLTMTQIEGNAQGSVHRTNHGGSRVFQCPEESVRQRSCRCMISPYDDTDLYS